MAQMERRRGLLLASGTHPGEDQQGLGDHVTVITSNDSTVATFNTLMMDKPEIISVEQTHRLDAKADKYIPHGEDIKAFLKREVFKPIICR
jgi:hypothetical protein